MELQVGKRYRRRDGEIAVVERDDKTDNDPFLVRHKDDSGYYWHRSNGEVNFSNGNEAFDLVEELATPAAPSGTFIERPPLPAPRSYVRNCLMINRGSETLFTQAEQGILATLDGYAVIPRELYDELMRR